jgi:hypothetical protein
VGRGGSRGETRSYISRYAGGKGWQSWEGVVHLSVRLCLLCLCLSLLQFGLVCLFQQGSSQSRSLQNLAFNRSSLSRGTIHYCLQLRIKCRIVQLLLLRNLLPGTRLFKFRLCLGHRLTRNKGTLRAR